MQIVTQQCVCVSEREVRSISHITSPAASTVLFITKSTELRTFFCLQRGHHDSFLSMLILDKLDKIQHHR